MPIEMPPFRSIYKYRDGSDKFFYDKIKEVVDTVNGMVENKTSTVSISVKDDSSNGVEGAKVKLSSGSTNLTSNATGSAGGTTLNNVPYGVYTVSVEAPEGYTALVSYPELTVNSETTTLNVSVNINE